MARFNSIFNLLVIFVSYRSFADGAETTLEERRVACSALFEGLDGFVSENYKSKDKFDKCCNDHIEKGEFGEYELFACVEQYFPRYKRGLGEVEQNFRGEANEANRKQLKDVLRTFQKALNSEDGTKTTDPTNTLKGAEIEGWIIALDKGSPVFSPATTSRLSLR